MRPVVAKVTSTNPLVMRRLDQFHGAAVAVSIVLENGPGTATYHLDYTFEDPNDLVSPVSLASIAWDNTMVPTAIKAGNVSGTFFIPTGPVWARMQWLSGASVRAIFTQYEAHRSYQVGPMPSLQILTLP